MVGLGLYRLRRVEGSSIAAQVVQKELCLRHCRTLSRLSQLRIVNRLPEALGSSYSLHQHQQLLNHPNLHLTSRRIVSASLGHSEAGSVFRSSVVSEGSRSVSRSHSRSTGVGLGGGVQRTPFGKVRQRSKLWTRRSEDERRESQGGATGSGSTTRRN